MLFGGQGPVAGSSSYGTYNDLWQFDIPTTTWTWVGGTSASMHQGNYGTKGVASIDNIPRSRYDASHWIEPDGTVVLFGGTFGLQRWDAPARDKLDDVWRFSSTDGTWTWIAGSGNLGTAASYGIPGQPNATNTPGGRSGSAAWSRPEGLFLFSGSSGSDLWKFDTDSSEWTFVKGSASKPPPVLGTPGEPSPENWPSGYLNGSCWKDTNGDIWMYNSQLWKLVFPTPARVDSALDY
jgi:hypothetical protein